MLPSNWHQDEKQLTRAQQPVEIHVHFSHSHGVNNASISRSMLSLLSEWKSFSCIVNFCLMNFKIRIHSGNKTDTTKAHLIYNKYVYVRN